MDFDLPEFPRSSESTRLIILALIQGLAEFLPISSSGHLNVFASFLGGKPSTLVNIALHFGTLMSIVVYYRKRIIALFKSDRRVLLLLIIGTIPAGVIGLIIKKWFPYVLENLMLTGLMFVITGIALCLFQPRKRKAGLINDKALDQSVDASTEIADSKSGYLDLTWKGALLIGTFQAFALMPGISRSGFTILAGLMIGMRRSSAAAFSFLLAIPAILGATILEIVDVIGTKPDEPFGWILLAAAVAFIVGWGSLALLVKMLNQGMIHWFAIWVLPLGLVVIIWQIAVQIAERAVF